jgi:hypothetical protein
MNVVGYLLTLVIAAALTGAGYAAVYRRLAFARTLAALFPLALLGIYGGSTFFGAFQTADGSVAIASLSGLGPAAGVQPTPHAGTNPA